MKRKRTADTRLGILATILLSCSVGFGLEGNSYHSPASGYRMAIPQGWIQIPDSVVHEMTNRALSAQGKSRVSYETAFQRATAGRWFEYPYVLIQVLPYSSFGIDRQIPKSQFGNLARVISGLDACDLTEKTLSREAQRLTSESAFGKAYLEAENNRFRYDLTMHVANVGKIRGATTGYFGKYAIVQINYYDRESNWVPSEPERDLISGSLRFDVNRAYDETYAGERSLHSRLAQPVLKGIVVTAFFTVVGLGCGFFRILYQVIRGTKTE
jgi:hypothetical protein